MVFRAAICVSTDDHQIPMKLIRQIFHRPYYRGSSGFYRPFIGPGRGRAPFHWQ
jgi:hypothetical protein